MANDNVLKINSNLYMVTENNVNRYLDAENLARMEKGLDYVLSTANPLESSSRSAKNNEIDKGAKYKVTIRNRYTGKTLEVDTYDMVEALKIVCPAMSHAFKKMANAGKRGVKDYGKDCDEAINSIEQSKLLQKFRE